MSTKRVFYFEHTDLFAGECNYCFLNRFAVMATTERGAVNVLSRYIGINHRFDGIKYVSRSGATAYYLIDSDMPDHAVEAFKPVNFDATELLESFPDKNATFFSEAINMSIKAVKQAINTQWQDMINNGRIPVMEYELNNGDWLLVEINFHDSYLTFSFDQDNNPCFFDGCVKGENGFYRYPLDEYFSSLDHYLQEISQNIVEGFLIPNNLDCVDGE